MSKIILVRHGETDLNKHSSGDSTERIRGWADVPLNEHGRDEANSIALQLRDRFYIDKIYSSPLIRATETARTISNMNGKLSIHETSDLMPWNLGDLTGKPVKDVIHIMQNYISHELKPIPGGEPFAAFRTRFLAFLRKCIIMANENNWQIALVTHTRDCQLARAWVANGYPDDLSIDQKTMDDYSQEVAPGNILVIKVGEQK